MNNSLIYALFMLLAGIGIPTLAALNGGLGARLGSATLATSLSLALGFSVAASFLLISEGLPSKIWLSGTSFYFYLGGLCIAFYIINVTWIAPRFGISNAIAFALLGAQVYRLDLKRTVGLALMIIGVFMVLNKSTSVTS